MYCGGGVLTNVARTCDPTPSLQFLAIKYVLTNFKQLENPFYSAVFLELIHDFIESPRTHFARTLGNV